MTPEQLQDLVDQPQITIESGDTLSGLIFPLRMIAKRSLKFHGMNQLHSPGSSRKVKAACF